jgi:adenylate cyclase, class 2
MSFLNVEIKARYSDHEKAREYMISQGADFKGIDHQTDTYFNVPHGRLKLREGNIENNLIQYDRENQAGPKNSVFNLVKIEDAAGLKDALTKSLGIKMIVAKKRGIYYINNVKFHLDEVEGLGRFIEIEAGNILSPGATQEDLKGQCDFYIKELEIEKENLMESSYSDLMATLS